MVFKSHFNENKVEKLINKCRSGKIDAVKFLLDEGVDINGMYNGDTPLCAATLNNHYEIVVLLVNRGANTLQKNAAGKSATSIAQANNYHKIYSFLYAKDLDQFMGGSSAEFKQHMEKMKKGEGDPEYDNKYSLWAASTPGNSN